MCTCAHSHTQQIPGISPTGRFTTIVPLALVLLATAVKEIIEDMVRGRNLARTLWFGVCDKLIFTTVSLCPCRDGSEQTILLTRAKWKVRKPVAFYTLALSPSFLHFTFPLLFLSLSVSLSQF